jgi:hypothetical protein
MRDAHLLNKDSIVSDIIFKICSMARDFTVYTNKSMVQLAKESGYLEYKDLVTKEEIIKVLQDHPSFISDWIDYSVDQRIKTGWYFIHRDNNKWVVGYYNGKGNENEQYFTLYYEACAIFILIEMEGISALI